MLIMPVIAWPVNPRREGFLFCMALTPFSHWPGWVNARHQRHDPQRNLKLCLWLTLYFKKVSPLFTVGKCCSVALWHYAYWRTTKQPSSSYVRGNYSPKLRHITRTQRINLSGLSEVFQDDPAELEYCKTDDQAADIFTKTLPPQKWGPALKLLGIRTDLANEPKRFRKGQRQRAPRSSRLCSPQKWDCVGGSQNITTPLPPYVQPM